MLKMQQVSGKKQKSPPHHTSIVNVPKLVRGHHLRLGRYFGKEFQHPPHVFLQ